MLRIKKLDLLLVKNFIGPFLITFFVVLFVLVMQFFFVYMDELIGKGLGFVMIIKQLVLMSATLVPMALPLAILLSSIMTFGNMGESLELVAIKSSGISLIRFIRPLFITVCFIGILAFYFSNNVIPVANLKAFSMLYDLRRSKPALNIREGIFNKDIPGYAIRIGEKGRDDKTIKDVVIYDQSSGRIPQLIVAKEGEMLTSSNQDYLIMRLKNGWRYQENAQFQKREKEDQTRMHFERWDKVIDLSSLKLNRTDEESFKGGHQFMNVQQLGELISTNNGQQQAAKNNVAVYSSTYVTAYNDKVADTLFKRIEAMKQAQQVTVTYDSTFASYLADSLKYNIVNAALNAAKSAENMMMISASDLDIHHMNGIKFKQEWHKKFTLSVACIILFLVGAPLGAIIRKGGLGLPLIFALIFFVIYHLLSRTGEQWVKAERVTPLVGMWMSTVIFIPLAAFLIIQARNDSVIISKDWYKKNWQRIVRLFKRTSNKAS